MSQLPQPLNPYRPRKGHQHVMAVLQSEASLRATYFSEMLLGRLNSQLDITLSQKEKQGSYGYPWSVLTLI